MNKVQSFNRILLNPKFICVISTIPSNLGNREKKMNFDNGVAKI